jgi:dinuclear metal center YbgI/SA1388 family protein
VKSKAIHCFELANYLSAFLDPLKIEDAAPNGLQVANTGPIFKIATAVTASLETIEQAVALGVQALIVHHGIFVKGDSYSVTGTKYRKIKLLIDHDIALLGYHLPLDAHREVGNNWQAARDLGLQNLEPFLEYGKIYLGVIGSTPEPISMLEFQHKVEIYYGRPAAAVAVKDIISSVAIVSGAGEKFIKDAARAGADCYITGRVDEPVWDIAHEENISFLGLGHYGTETVGPKALALYVQEKLGISSSFIQTENPF